MTDLKIKDWDKFQHYKSKNGEKPVWIKLYRNLLDDYEFHSLSAESRAILPMLWLIASENEGVISSDFKKVAFRLRQTVKEIENAISPLISKGFIESRIILESVYNDSIPEDIENIENIDKRRGERESGLDDLSQAVFLYNDLASKINLPLVQKISATRKKHLSARLKDCGGIEGWKDALSLLEKSSFCKGSNDRGWKADFDFLIKESSFIKLMEGKYNARTSSSDKTKEQLQEWVDGG